MVDDGLPAEYGDRRQELVLIGENLDAPGLEARAGRLPADRRRTRGGPQRGRPTPIRSPTGATHSATITTTITTILAARPLTTIMAMARAIAAMRTDTAMLAERLADRISGRMCWRVHGPGRWTALCLVLCLLLAQHAGLVHRVVHGGLPGMASPWRREAATDATDSHTDSFALKLGLHSCVLFDGATRWRTATTAASTCRRWPFGKPVKPAALAWRWPDLPAARPFHSPRPTCLARLRLIARLRWEPPPPALRHRIRIASHVLPYSFLLGGAPHPLAAVAASLVYRWLHHRRLGPAGRSSGGASGRPRAANPQGSGGHRQSARRRPQRHGRAGLHAGRRRTGRAPDQLARRDAEQPARRDLDLLRPERRAGRSSRGLDGDRIKVLQNSGSTLDASTLSYDHAVPIDPLVAEKIEVVRGPAAR